MTAEKVFEQFGFNKEVDDRYMIEYVKLRVYDKELKVVIRDTIQFFKTLGTVVITHTNNGNPISSITLTMEIYAAITKQLKELGWIETTAQDDDEMEQDGVEIR
jgi:hypothetical protein